MESYTDHFKIRPGRIPTWIGERLMSVSVLQAEELLEVDGCYIRESWFSSGVWHLVGWSYSNSSALIDMWEALIRPIELFFTRKGKECEHRRRT